MSSFQYTCNKNRAIEIQYDDSTGEFVVLFYDKTQSYSGQPVAGKMIEARSQLADYTLDVIIPFLMCEREKVRT